MLRPLFAALGALLIAITPLIAADSKQKPSTAAKPQSSGSAATPPAAPADTREAITLNAHERARMLEGMRAYLEALQGITAALAANDSKGVADYARRAGARMLETAPASVPLKSPIAFTAASLNTHEKFDVLAERAGNSASRGEVLGALAEIMANCTTCHATYRVVPAP